VFEGLARCLQLGLCQYFLVLRCLSKKLCLSNPAGQCWFRVLLWHGFSCFNRRTGERRKQYPLNGGSQVTSTFGDHNPEQVPFRTTRIVGKSESGFAGRRRRRSRILPGPFVGSVGFPSAAEGCCLGFRFIATPKTIAKGACDKIEPRNLSTADRRSRSHWLSACWFAAASSCWRRDRLRSQRQ